LRDELRLCSDTDQHTNVDADGIVADSNIDGRPNVNSRRRLLHSSRRAGLR
jgi:hypothetical protein